MRYQEEICLLEEEKRRVLVSLEQHALVWDRREKESLCDHTPEAQGRAMYAAEQAAIRRQIKTGFATTWRQTQAQVPAQDVLIQSEEVVVLGGYESDESVQLDDDSDVGD